MTATPPHALRRIGILDMASPDGDRLAHWDIFKRSLGELGHVEGEDIALEFRWADGLPEVRDALKQAFGGVAVLPVLPRDGADAIRVLVRAAKSGAAGVETIYPALSLNDAQGKPTAAAEAVLRAGEALSIATI